MGLHASTSTEHATRNNGSTCLALIAVSNAYRHLRISFHAAYLTAAKDVAVDGTITDDDFRIASTCVNNTHHGFSTLKGIVFTFTATKYITSDSNAFFGFQRNGCVA